MKIRCSLCIFERGILRKRASPYDTIKKYLIVRVIFEGSSRLIRRLDSASDLYNGLRLLCINDSGIQSLQNGESQRSKIINTSINNIDDDAWHESYEMHVKD